MPSISSTCRGSALVLLALALPAAADPLSDWPARRAEALGASTTDAAFAAAWWALENGLTDECSDLLRELHRRDPDHAPTARMVAALDRLAAPCPDPDLSPLAPILPARHQHAHGAHVLIVHDLDDAGAAERIALLEQVLTAFYLSFAAYGIELNPPPQRLVAVWFPDPASYQTALRAVGAGDFATTRGYYHPTLGVVMTYDGRSEPSHARSRLALDARRQTLDRAKARLHPGATAEQARLDAQRLDLDRRREALDRARIEREYGVAAHELIHQLVRASGLAARHESFPVWLHEGLAMQFEVVRDGRWAGISRLNPHRLPFWNRAGAAPARLVPLLRDRPFTGGYRAEPYAHAWALVYYLRKAHPDAFLALLDRLRTPIGPGRSPGERASEAFESLFGPDLTDLETSWRRYIDALPGATPETTAGGPPEEKGRPRDSGGIRIAPAGIEPATSRL